MFEGHIMYTVGKDWVFNLTEFNGYRVYKDKEGKVVKYTKAFNIMQVNGNYDYEKYINVPIRVLETCIKIIENYREEAFIAHVNH